MFHKSLSYTHILVWKSTFVRKAFSTVDDGYRDTQLVNMQRLRDCSAQHYMGDLHGIPPWKIQGP